MTDDTIKHVYRYFTSIVYTFIHGRYRGYENPYPSGVAAARNFDIHHSTVPASFQLHGTRSMFIIPL